MMQGNGRELVRVYHKTGAIMFADDLTLDEAKYAITQLLKTYVIAPTDCDALGRPPTFDEVYRANDEALEEIRKFVYGS